MKYKDYYAILGVDRKASADDIKKAYRKLAQKYHPDMSKEKDAKERFQQIGEAYQTLKDPEKRAAYDQLGTGFRPGQDFRPPPDWERQFRSRGAGRGGMEGATFEDLDLGDLFETLFGARGAGGGGGPARSPRQRQGEDYDVPVQLSLDEAYRGTQVDLSLQIPEIAANGAVRHVPKKIKARIPKGAIDGLRLRLRGQGGKGRNGGRDGDIFLDIKLRPHPFFKPSGHDIYLDLPLTPWEAALGATVEVPTLAGAVNLKIPPGTTPGHKLRLGGKGMPNPGGSDGDLYAIVQIVNPAALNDREKELYQQLASTSRFDPRRHFTST
jgi:curved DNA-binding protein